MTRLRAFLLALAAGLGTVLTAAASASAADPGVPPLRHVFVILLENKNFDETFGLRSPVDPYLSQTLPSEGALLPQYYGVTHYSLGNYIALLSGQGSNPATQADCQLYVNVVPGTVGADGQATGAGCVYPRPVPTLADQLTASGRSWKGYMEDMGTPCRHPALNSRDTTQTAKVGDQYAARHNPYVYFHSIIDTPACAQNDVPLTALPADLGSAATTPTFSFITPNLCNDAHDAMCVDARVGGLTASDAWLRTWVPRITASPGYQNGGLLMVLFDESEGANASTACCGEPQFPNTPSNGGPSPGPGGGRMGAVMLSPYIEPGTVDPVAYNHFTLLASLEDAWGLSRLGFAARPGLKTLGPDLFTCTAPVPVTRRGKLPRGSLLKSVAVSQGVAARPSLDVKLWFAGGRIKVTLKGVKRFVRRVAAATPCGVNRITLPRRHGVAVVTASGFGGLERRTVRF